MQEIHDWIGHLLKKEKSSQPLKTYPRLNCGPGIGGAGFPKLHS